MNFCYQPTTRCDIGDIVIQCNQCDIDGYGGGHDSASDDVDDDDVCFAFLLINTFITVLILFDGSIIGRSLNLVC